MKKFSLEPILRASPLASPVRVLVCKTDLDQGHWALEVSVRKTAFTVKICLSGWWGNFFSFFSWGNFFLSFWYPRRKKNNKTRSVNKGVRVSGCLLLLKIPAGTPLPGWKQAFVEELILEGWKDTGETVWEQEAGRGRMGRDEGREAGEPCLTEMLQ